MKILFFSDPYPNYVPDLLLHGLRSLMGADVIDYPKKECLYDGVLGTGVYERGQLCPQWFPQTPDAIDRSDIWSKVKSNYFTFIVVDIRAFHTFVKKGGQPPERVVPDRW